MLDAEFIRQHTDEGSFARGQRYFSEGRVVGLREAHPDFWTARVLGTSWYEVEITMGLHDSYAYCTCPAYRSESERVVRERGPAEI